MPVIPSDSCKGHEERESWCKGGQGEGTTHMDVRRGCCSAGLEAADQFPHEQLALSYDIICICICK